MSLWKNYHIAESIQDAVDALHTAEQPACLVAGGTDLLLEMQQGHHSPVTTLVDITRVAELRCLELRDEQLFIGAGVPVNEISQSSLVLRHAQAVAEGCGLIGGPQVRNSATLGGNVAHALPAADGMIGLLALDATVEIAGQSGRRSAAMHSLFLGPGRSVLSEKRELLVGFRVSARQPGEASAFKRIMRPQGVALPVLNIAVWIRREQNRIAAIRIAVGPAGPTPQRAGAVENFLTGVMFNQANLDGAINLMNSSMRFRTSPYRATAEYRHHVAGVLFRDVITTAWERTFEDEVHE